MTADHIHDALTLLPSDLIAEADRKRQGTPKKVLWKPIAAMAACFALLLCSGWYCMLLFGAGGGSVTEQAAAEAPMLQEKSEAAAPMEAEEAEDLCGVPLAPTELPAADNRNAASESLCIDHAHHPAEPYEAEPGAWCGNMTAAIYLDGTTYSLSGTDAVTLTDILYQLDYAPETLCRCPAEFTADTEMGTGYAISLTDYFVRFEDSQAGLTEAQAETLRQLLAGLK